jgi:hypothetical protein
VTELIDFLDAGRRESLRMLADKVGASDDTAMTAWLAWQELVKLSDSDRTKAVGLVLAFEEIHRKANGVPPLFAGRVR